MFRFNPNFIHNVWVYIKNTKSIMLKFVKIYCDALFGLTFNSETNGLSSKINLTLERSLQNVILITVNNEKTL